MGTISDSDVSVDSSGNIRWTGAATTNKHTVLEFIQWLMDKQDDGQAVGDDLLDITVDTAYSRSTDQILTLNSPFNIDDAFARHLYDGSVSQTNNGGETLYSGLGVIGPVESGTEYVILQDGKKLEPFWGTGINAEASPSLVFSRHLVKSKDSGAEIDGQRIVVLARELGDQYRRFPTTLGTGNSVAAIGNGADVFNETDDATLAAISDITNTEGFQDIDIDGISNTEEYYAQWTKGANDVNDVYEYTKYLSQRSHTADSETYTGNDVTIDDAAARYGLAQQFTSTAKGEILTGAKLSLKGAGTLADQAGEIYAELYANSGSNPTGSALAQSEVLPISMITNANADWWFQFNWRNPSDGTDQRAGLTLTASTAYHIVLRHLAATATEYVTVDGDTSTGAGCSEDTNSSDSADTWGTVTNTGLGIEVYTANDIHGIAGDRFEGINVDVGYDAETGTLPENTGTTDDIVFWGTAVGYDGGTGTFLRGERVQIWDSDSKTTLHGGGKCLYGVTGATGTLYIAQDTPSTIAEDYYILGVESGAEADPTASITNNAISGGEGLVLAKDDNTGSGEVYLQVISGVNPVENAIIYDGGAPTTNNVTCTATIVTRTLNPEFLGASTGTNIIGAYGIGFNVDDVGSSDRFTDLGNQSRQPPNNQTFTVSGLVAGEDRVLVAPRTGTAINKSQGSLDTALTGGTETVVSVDSGAATPTETPSNGTLRVELDTGIYRRVRYESVNTTSDYTILADDTFVDGDVDVGDDHVTITNHAFATGDLVQLSNAGGALPGGLSTLTDYYIIKVNANDIRFALSYAAAIAGTDETITSAAGGGTHTIEVQDMEDWTDPNDSDASSKDVFLSYIDWLARDTTESYTAVHTSNRDLFVRVRDGGATPIKTFELDSAQFLSQTVTVAAVRTSDA